MVGVQESHGNFAELKHLGDSMRSSHFLAWSPLEHKEIYNNQDLEHNVCLSRVASESGDESESEGESIVSQSSCGGVSLESDFCKDSDPPKENQQQRDVKASSRPRGGGCLSTIRRSSFGPAAVCVHVAVIPGRCLQTTITDKDKTTIFINLHLHNLTSEQIKIITQLLDNHFERAERQPLRYFVVVVGDFNFRYEDKSVLQVKEQQCIFKQPKYSKHIKSLKQTLDNYIRMEHDHHTHFNPALNHLNEIDFVYLSAPGWSQLPWQTLIKVDAPELLFAKNISDHGSISCKLNFSQTPGIEQPIAPWVAKLPAFKTCLENLVQASKLDKLMPEHSLAQYKILIREAGRLARNYHNNKYRDTPKLKLANLILIARLVSQNKFQQAQKLILCHTFFFARIKVQQMRVELHDAAAFSNEYRIAKLEHCNRLLEYETKQQPSKPNASKISAAARMSKLWKAVSPSNHVSSVLRADGSETNSIQDMASELGSSWAPTFSKVDPVPPEGFAFLKDFSSPWSMDGVHPPCVGLMSSYVASLKNSAPGPDGIPFSCYKALCLLSGLIFFKANLVLLSGGHLGIGFNIQRGCFIPKNSPNEGPIPTAEELRTLGLKNTDNKAITGANVRQFSSTVSRYASLIQRGFVQGRQLVLDIVDIDAISRALSNFNIFPMESVLALWDFKAAFPSMRHAWIKAVFKAFGFPKGFLFFLDALFLHNYAIYISGGFQAFLYLILAGIVQGCPAAGLCFAVGADPFFQELTNLQTKFQSKKHAHDQLAFRGCADDIGGALASYKFLKIVKPIFNRAASFAGLTLNPKKCVLIPTKFDSFDEKAEEIRHWLSINIPEWAGFRIRISHAYLGPAIGPGASDSMWEKPIAKYWERVLRIAACGLSAFYSVLAYNTYAGPCLDYLCQMYWVPPSLLRLETRAISKILKIPQHAFGVDGPPST